MIYYVQKAVMHVPGGWMTQEWEGVTSDLAEAVAFAEALSTKYTAPVGIPVRVIGVSEAHYPPGAWRKEEL